MIEIKKTYKNYVGGKYVRSESGKTFTLNLKNDLNDFHVFKDLSDLQRQRFL